MRPRRMLAAVTATVLTASLISSTPGTARIGASPRLSDIDDRSGRTVTLITGDRITWHGPGRFGVEPGTKTRFVTYAYGDHHYVIPPDALPLLRSGRLDWRLFDINALLEADYHRRGTLPLIVTGEVARAATMTVTRELPAINGYAATATSAQLKSSWQRLVRSGAKIWLDGMRKLSLDVSVPQIGAPAAWAAGLDGAGVTVAVLDTGIDATHPDLVGKVAAAHNFAADAEDALDRAGHGTHIASTIAGSGVASNGKYKGAAPGVQLLDGKVCIVFGCAESWVIAGMRWAAEQGAQVVNMSFSGPDLPGLDPLELAVNELTARHGTLFVASAGNSGLDGDYTVGSPASADAALAVGSVDKTGKLAPSSSRGPGIGDLAVKPEITGPGVSITAARSKDAPFGPPEQRYVAMSGTSMATPHVVAAAAILTQKHPQWTAARRKAVLMGSAQPNADAGTFAQGAGRVDVARAMNALVFSDPASVSFGTQPWPHEDDPVMTKAVTYHNAGAGDVVLQLSLSNSANGVFSLGATSITVPAGGSASVDLVADTRQGSAVGLLGGRLVAIADGVRVVTPFGVERQEQRVWLKAVHTDRAGAPAESHVTLVVNTATGKEYQFFDSRGTAEALLPVGPYIVMSWIRHLAGGEDLSTTMLVWPRLELTGDRTIELDARLGKPVFVSVPDPTVALAVVDIGTRIEFDDDSVTGTVAASDFSEVYTEHLGPEGVRGMSAAVQAVFGRRIGETLDPSLLYNLAWQQEGRFYSGFEARLRQRDLATIKAHFAKHTSAAAMMSRFPGLRSGYWIFELPFAVPGENTFHLNDDVVWGGRFAELVPSEHGYLEQFTTTLAPSRRYEAGKTYHERFNRGVFGPTLPHYPDEAEWLSRTGNRLTVDPPLHGDGDGRAGFGEHKTGSTVLYRDGQLVKKIDEPYADFDVPPAAHRYRLESTVHRVAPARLTTKVHVVWEFASSHVEKTERLPVTAIGFRPDLDDHNTARAGAFMVIPVNVWQQPHSPAKRITSLQIDVSTDDGATWRQATVLTLPGQRFLLLRNPDTSGFISLRANATDLAGNTVDQTIIRAFEVK